MVSIAEFLFQHAHGWGISYPSNDQLNTDLKWARTYLDKAHAHFGLSTSWKADDRQSKASWEADMAGVKTSIDNWMKAKGFTQ